MNREPDRDSPWTRICSEAEAKILFGLPPERLTFAPDETGRITLDAAVRQLRRFLSGVLAARRDRIEEAYAKAGVDEAIITHTVGRQMAEDDETIGLMSAKLRDIFADDPGAVNSAAVDADGIVLQSRRPADA